MPQAGDPITPTIRLVRELGSGGMGSVWVADHGALQTQVVVKFMHVELTGDRDSVLRFSREAAAGANVKSPHVVQVLDHGIAPDGAPFIVMELLEGSDLAAHCAKNGPMPLLEVEHVISQACKALSRAHERGIVHRDIKPQNIFLTNVGGGELFVKVLDFGIAKAGSAPHGLSSATKTGALMGTPYYMSPEQTIGAKGVDHRTDLWALGVVAFECLTGQKPFDAETIGGLAVAICSGPTPVPSQVNRALPAEVDAWFSRACAREAGQRFGSAKEMADALHLLVTGRSTDPRFSHEPRGSTHGSSVPGATSQAPALGVTTRAPVSGEADDPVVVPKRRSAGVVLAIAATVVVVGGAIGLKLAGPSAAPSSAAGSAHAPEVEAPGPVASVVPSSPATPSATPSASAAVAVALSPLPAIVPPSAAPPPRKASGPAPANPKQQPSTATPANAKSAPAPKSTDRDSIE
jgi:serine/threonine-protein kinase